MMIRERVRQSRRKPAICPECRKKYKKAGNHRRCHECSRRLSQERVANRSRTSKRVYHEVGSLEAYEQMILGNLGDTDKGEGPRWRQ